MMVWIKLKLLASCLILHLFSFCQAMKILSKSRLKKKAGFFSKHEFLYQEVIICTKVYCDLVVYVMHFFCQSIAQFVYILKASACFVRIESYWLRNLCFNDRKTSPIPWWQGNSSPPGPNGSCLQRNCNSEEIRPSKCGPFSGGFGWPKWRQFIHG